jgi:hypothetical protein
VNRAIIALIAMAAVVAAGVCLYVAISGGNGPAEPDSGETGPKTDDDGPDQTVEGMELVLTVDGRKVNVAWEDNPSVDALRALAGNPITISMERYGGFEQTGSMESAIVRDDTSIQVGCGDIVLYRGIQICLYFDDNSYSFTRLGKISGMSDSEIRSMLDKPSVTAVLSLERTEEPAYGIIWCRHRSGRTRSM